MNDFGFLEAQILFHYFTFPQHLRLSPTARDVLVVPRLADFCIILSAEEDGALRQVAVAHSNLSDAPALRKLSEEFPSSSAAQRGGAQVVRTGKSDMCCDMRNGALQEIFEEQEDRDLILSFAPTSFIAVPLKTHDRVRGVAPRQ